MSVKKLNLKYRFKDKFLNIVLENYKDKINFILDSIYEADEVDAFFTGRNIDTVLPLAGGGTLGATRTLGVTGLSTLGTNNYIVGVQDDYRDGWEYKSLLGTTNQVTVTHAVGSITLSTPQNIHTGATPTFTGLTLVNAITEFSTDGTMGGNSDDAVPTEAAVVTYVAAQITAEDLDYAGDGGTGAVDLNSQIFTLAGTDPIDTAASSQTLTISHKTTNGYVHTPASGSSAQILQYSSAGTAKWITVSSEASIADGGAITLGGSPSFVNLTLTGELDITKATALLIDLNPGFTGTGNVIELTPSAAISTEDAAYCGFFLDGTSLTPTSAGVEIDGIFIDFSAITLAQTPEVHGLHVKMPGQETALHTDGEIHVDYATGSSAGAEYTAMDVILDVSSLDANSEIHGLDVALAGSTSGSVAALGSHPGIDVIHQHVGTFGNIDTGYTLVGSTYTAEAFTSATAIVAANGDSILIGEDAVFDEIQVAMTVVATKTAFLKFYYSYDNAGTAAWTQFFPADDTEGFVYSGTIRMNSADLVAGGWEANDPDDGGGVTATKFYIKITRNRTASIGSPTATLKTLASTEYMWDKNADVNIRNLSLSGTLGVTGTVTIPAALTGVIRADSGVLSVDSTADDKKVKVDSGATADYIGAAYSDGVLRVTQNELTYADGGNFITLGLADHNTARTALGLAIGSDVLAYDAGLSNLAGIAMQADRFYYTSGDNTHVAGTVTSAGRDLIDDANAGAQRTTLGLVIGTDVQAYDATIIVDADFNSAGLCATDGSGTYSIVTDNSATWDGLISCTFANVDTALAVANSAVDFNSQNLTGVGTIASGDITVDAKLVLSAGSITDGDGAISFGDENLSTTGTLGSNTFTMTSNSDTVAISHNGSNAFLKWSDGTLNLQNTEANTAGEVHIHGAGTGFGDFKIHDENDEEYIEIACLGGEGKIATKGIAPGRLDIQGGSPSDIAFWRQVASGNPYFYIHGRGTAANEWLRIRVEADNDALIEAEHDLNILAGGGNISFGDETLTTSGSISSTGTTGFIAGDASNTGLITIYDGSDHKITITSPAIAADYALTLPIDDGGVGDYLSTDGSGTLSWAAPPGGGDVSAAAVITDHTIVRGNGGAKGVQDSGIVIDDSDNISGVGTLATAGKITIGAAIGTASSMLDVRDNADDAWIASFEQDHATGWGVLIEMDSEVGSEPAIRIDNGAGRILNVGSNGLFVLDIGNIRMDSATSTITGGAKLNIESGVTGIHSDTIYGDTAGSSSPVHIDGTHQLYRQTSAKKYKEQIEDLPLDSSLIYNLRPVTYVSKCKIDKGKEHIGFVAEEIEVYYPEIIIYNKDGGVEDYNDRGLSTLMLVEVQSQHKEIQNLRQELDELKNK